MDKLSVRIEFIELALGSFEDYADENYRKFYLKSRIAAFTDDLLFQDLLKGYIRLSEEELKEEKRFLQGQHLKQLGSSEAVAAPFPLPASAIAPDTNDDIRATVSNEDVIGVEQEFIIDFHNEEDVIGVEEEFIIDSHNEDAPVAAAAAPDNATSQTPWYASKTTKTTVGVAAACAAVGVVATPALLGAAGFTVLGPAAGSYAAAWMSSIAVANGGVVAAGSTFAMLQSAAMGGAAVVPVTAAAGTASATLGAAGTVTVKAVINLDLPQKARDLYARVWLRQPQASSA